MISWLSNNLNQFPASPVTVPSSSDARLLSTSNQSCDVSTTSFMQAAVTQRSEHAKLEQAEAQESCRRAKRELGGLHRAWDSHLDELKQENQ